MSLILFLAVSGVILALAYRWYGNVLARFLNLETSTSTPAHARRDGLDYEPAKMSWLLPQHFSAIAAAGPIVGPILAATYFGWLPAWLWIIFGAILIGGVHDLMALTASVRHGAHSIAEVVRQYMNRRSYLLFLAFVWISLVYVIIAFADVTASTFGFFDKFNVVVDGQRGRLQRGEAPRDRQRGRALDVLEHLGGDTTAARAQLEAAGLGLLAPPSAP